MSITDAPESAAGASNSNLSAPNIQSYSPRLVGNAFIAHAKQVQPRGLLNHRKPPARKPLTLDQLKTLWNSQSDRPDHYWLWDNLGLDEIVEFAQTAHNINGGQP